jgi:hypothetical protein
MKFELRNITVGGCCGSGIWIDAANNSVQLSQCFVNGGKRGGYAYRVNGNCTVICCTGAHGYDVTVYSSSYTLENKLIRSDFNFITNHFEGYSNAGLVMGYGLAILTRCKFIAGDDNCKTFNHHIIFSDSIYDVVHLFDCEFTANTGVVSNTGADISVELLSHSIINYSSKKITMKARNNDVVVNVPQIHTSYTYNSPALCFNNVNIDNMKYFFLDNKKHMSGNKPPTSGDYKKGDIIYNTNPTQGGYIGWTCIQDGTPGTWKGFGLIEP